MRKLILIVEDEPLNLKLARDFLEINGYETIEATDGKSAIGLARDNKPDLILMDNNLPVMNGVEATRRIRADRITRKIPIIAITASAMKGDEARIISAGFDGYVSKPYDLKILLKRVKDLIS